MKSILFVLIVVSCIALIGCTEFFGDGILDVITGDVETKFPEISLFADQTEIINAVGRYQFGGTHAGSSSVAVTFTIENNGQADLTLSDDPLIQISGTGSGAFSVAANPEIKVAPGTATTFSIVFSPPGVSEYTAEVDISTNDPDIPDFTFTLLGTGVPAPVPAMKVLVGAAVLSSSEDTYDFGEIIEDTVSPGTVFTIQNLGQADLTLSGDPLIEISGTGSGVFSVSSNPETIVAPGTATTFSLTFSPAEIVEYTAEVAVNSNDPTITEFVFSITGTGVAPPAGEIQILENEIEIAHGSGITYASTINVDGVGGESASRTFTVKNLGPVDLAIAPAISGTDEADFTVDTMGMLSTLGPVGSGTDETTFVVDFDPVTAGDKNSQLIITSNDPDKAEYAINLYGAARWWGIQSLGSVGSRDDQDLTNFGSIVVIEEDPLVDGDDVYLAYCDIDAGEVVFRKSLDGGATWTTPVTAASWLVSGWVSQTPALAVNGDELLIAFQHFHYGDAATTDDNDSELRLVRSADGGATWGPTVIGESVDDTIWLTGYWATMGVDEVSGDIYIVHYCGANVRKDLNLAKWDASESTWIRSIIDEPISWSMGLYPEMVNVGETLYVSYYDQYDQYLRFARSSDGGVSWETKLNVDGGYPTLDRGAHSSIFANGSNVYLAYVDWLNSSDTEVYYIESADGGDTWGTPVAVLSDTGDTAGYYSALHVDGSDVFLSYYDWGSGLTGDLKFAGSSDTGATWPVENRTDIETVGDVGLYLEMAVANNRIYVLYYDSTEGEAKLAKSVNGGSSF